MRPLTDLEKKAVLAMANEVGSDEVRNQLLLDLDRPLVEAVSPDGSRLMFRIDGYQCPPHRGQDTFRGKDGFPVEGTMHDADGAEMDVLLFVVHGRVYELELVRHMGGPVLRPDWNSFRVK